ncbi:MAG: hypothetical protein GTO41_24955 [Burkholderiales bacterium]|nr:hypothetical protein [Burkholderiales bacterium]
MGLQQLARQQTSLRPLQPAQADARPYLEQLDSLFVTGPTNTNLMDSVIAVVE